MNDALYQMAMQHYQNAERQQQMNPRVQQQAQQQQAQQQGPQPQGPQGPQNQAPPQEEEASPSGLSYEELAEEAMRNNLQSQLKKQKRGKMDKFLDMLGDFGKGAGEVGPEQNWLAHGANYAADKEDERSLHENGSVGIDSKYLEHLRRLKEGSAHQKMREEANAEKMLYLKAKTAAEGKKSQHENEMLGIHRSRIELADKKEMNIAKKMSSLEEYRKKTINIQAVKSIKEIQKQIKDEVKDYTESVEYMAFSEKEKPIRKKEEEQKVRAKYEREIKSLLGILDSLKKPSPHQDEKNLEGLEGILEQDETSSLEGE